MLIHLVSFRRISITPLAPALPHLSTAALSFHTFIDFISLGSSLLTSSTPARFPLIKYNKLAGIFDFILTLLGILIEESTVMVIAGSGVVSFFTTGFSGC